MFDDAVGDSVKLKRFIDEHFADENCSPLRGEECDCVDVVTSSCSVAADDDASLHVGMRPAAALPHHRCQQLQT